MSKIKICLDAGHYGKYNQSPAVPDYYESEMNWKLHLLLKEALEDYGMEVITTRANQAADLGLVARGRKGEGCDLFLSIHSNAVGGDVREDIDYVAVYHLTDDATTKVDDIAKALAGKLAPVIANVMGTKQGYEIFASKASYDRNGDGVMNDNYYGVLHGARMANCPGLILEHSFHTNTRSTQWLMNEANLAKLARAEAEVIAAYFGAEKPEEKPAPTTGPKPYTLEMRQLYRGCKGPDVAGLQAMLQYHGYYKGYEIDSSFGPGTDTAVRAFQSDRGLGVDGYVGKNTMSKLMAT